MAVVDQLVPSVVPGDATTGHTLQLQRLLRERGHRSEIYALAVHPELERRVRLLHELDGPSRPERFLIYQMSSPSSIADWLIGRREQVAVDYHNLTPASFFRGWDHQTMRALQVGEVQVAQLAQRSSLGIGDSRFNVADLQRRGWTATAVAPVLVNFADFDAEPDEMVAGAVARARTANRWAGRGLRWLFVGALAPHKAQHRLIAALAHFRMAYDPDATLTLVGRPVVRSYAAALAGYAEALGLGPAVELTGGIGHRQLVAHYQGADVLVSASEHEGFCVPLLEALHHGLPVVARATGAVPETLGPAGVLVEGRSAPAMAAAVARVATDAGLRAALAGAGAQRVSHFALARTRSVMETVLESWMEGDRLDRGERVWRMPSAARSGPSRALRGPSRARRAPGGGVPSRARWVPGAPRWGQAGTGAPAGTPGSPS